MNQKRIILILIFCIILAQYAECRERQIRQLVTRRTSRSSSRSSRSSSSSTTSTNVSSLSTTSIIIIAVVGTSLFIGLIVFFVIRARRKSQQTSIAALSGQPQPMNNADINQQMMSANQQMMAQGQNGTFYQQTYQPNSFQNNNVMMQQNQYGMQQNQYGMQQNQYMMAQNQYGMQLNNTQGIPAPQPMYIQGQNANLEANNKQVPIIQNVML